MSKNKVDFSKGIYDARQLGTPRMLLLGFQHMFAMFGATVLVPLITGLDIEIWVYNQSCQHFYLNIQSTFRS